MRKGFVGLLAMCLSWGMMGQGGLEQTFIRRYNLMNRQGGLAITTSPEGGFIATGQHMFNGAAGECDVYVYKVDVCGNREWFNLYGTPESEGGKSIEPTDDGGYVIGGSKIQLGSGAGESFVMKLAADGGLEWHKYIEGLEWVFDVQPLASGFIASGQAASAASLVRLDDAGNVIWARRYPALSDKALKVSPLSDGGFFFVTNETFSGSDVQAARVDALGNLIWQKQYGTGYIAEDFAGFLSWGTTALVDPVTEETYVMGSTVNGGIGQSDILLMKLDITDGDVEWSRVLGSPGKDVGRNLIFVPGGIALVGSTDGYGSPVSNYPDALYQEMAALDILLVKINTTGSAQVEWAQTYGGNQLDKGIGVQYDDDLGYTISAHTYSTIFGTTHSSPFFSDSMDPLFIRTDFEGAVSCQNIPVSMPLLPIAVAAEDLPATPAPWNTEYPDPFGIFQATVTLQGAPMSPGDVIGAFDAEGNCVGSAPVQMVGAQSRVDLALFGEEFVINANNSFEGFTEDEPFTLRAWRATDGMVTFHDATLPAPPGEWVISNLPIPGYDNPATVYDFAPPTFAPTAVTGNITVTPFEPEDTYMCQECFNEPQFDMDEPLVCLGDTVTVVNTTQLGLRCHQYWYLEGPGVEWDSIPGSTDTLQFVMYESGTFTVRLKSICGGPDSEFEQPFEVYDVDAQAFAPAPYNGFEVSCPEETDGSITEAAVGGYAPFGNYNWEWQAASGAIVDTSGLGVGLYKGVVTDLLGCTDTIEVLLEAPDPLSMDAQVVSNFNGFAVSCFDAEDGRVALNASGGIPNYAFPAEDGFATNDTLSGLAPGENVFTVIDANGCTAFDTLHLSAPLPPLLILSTTPDTCESGEGQLRADFAVDVPPALVIWPDGFSAPIPLSAFSEQQVGLDAGLYKVELVDGNGCLSTIEVEVPATLPSEVELLSGPEEVCFPGADVEFVDLTGDSIAWRQWDFGDGYVQARPGGDDNGADEAQHTYLSSGSFEVVLTVMNGAGCISEGSTVVDVIDGMTVFVPSAFTPDNDGLNDGFGPVLTGVESFHMWIFNRWGDAVFETDREGWWWNGSPENLGRSSKTDLFTWRLEAQGSCDAFKIYTGTVVLLR